MGNGFYICSDNWFRGKHEELELGHVSDQLNVRYRNLFSPNHGRARDAVLEFVKLCVETMTFCGTLFSRKGAGQEGRFTTGAKLTGSNDPVPFGKSVRSDSFTGLDT